VSEVRRTDPRRRKYDRPDGVAPTFQVSEYKVEPRPAKRAVNLFPKDEVRATLADEPVPVGPKVPLVIKPAARACDAERLTRTGTGPEGVVVGDAGKPQGVGPPAQPGEEVQLGVAVEVGGSDVSD